MNILLSCANGLSTSLVAQKIEKYMEEVGEQGKVWAVDIDSVENELQNNKIDCILLAPQVQYARREIQKVADKYEVPMINVSGIDYGRMDTRKIYNGVLKALGKQPDA